MTRNISRETLIKWAPLLVLMALVIFFTLLNPTFFSVRNFARIAIASAPALMVAVGVTFIIIMGSIDLSMEGVISLTAVIFSFAFVKFGGALGDMGWLAMPLVLLVGGLIGLLNGLIHVKLRIPSFMASLAMGFVGTGAAILLTGGDIVKISDPAFRGLLTVRWLGFPIMVYVAVAFLLLAWFIQSHTTLGRNFYAVGGGEDLAHASGLNVKRVRVTGFALAGVFYAIAAILVVGRIGQAESVTGANFMFVSITSVVVGGVALWGGIGGVWNALVGVLIVGVINNGMVVIGLPDFLQDGVLGLLVIVAVVLSTDRRAVSVVK
ncbi:ABC transporter permease [Gemmobacter fulvus]|uniref:Autoinducer 2 import system permease protein LsrD n=1 Tax=Gemmobacter fulvus TaxID=2840474 RepID=A0A975S0G9_9RHOB|nr:ABC transporter permease [Gemmobacter fulvus]MBT9247229.1 ABC transporter permease [Gemmobacter fulvus]MDQ1849971.1 ABC transporter permease [Gemmobacter fulvus]QWK88898.1 ABC transporter permease [Gemmobacter fulvus]